MESELFGHERGAFTGADKAQAGAFERAHTGTVFLDEMGELPLDLQPKLLRLLENREVSRLGGGAPKKVDVRVVAATNRDLRRMVNAGQFRSDLFFRLSVVEVRLPALRERPEDIPMLVRRFIDELSGPPGSRLDDDGDGRGGAAALRLSPGTLERLKHHPWPGNVRELRNFVLRSVALAEGTLVSAAPSLVELPGGAPPLSGSPLAAASAAAVATPAPPAAGASYEELALAAARQSGHFDLPYKRAKRAFGEPFEKAYLAALLERAGGNLSEAARLADVDRTYLHQLLRKFDLR
jgi:transcriptional regulator with GAF, ATPase, and Fis domain